MPRAAPDADSLPGVECPLKTLLLDGAAPADGLGLLRLDQCGAGGADREEEVRVLAAARGMCSPVVHQKSPAIEVVRALVHDLLGFGSPVDAW